MGVMDASAWVDLADGRVRARVWPLADPDVVEDPLWRLEVSRDGVGVLLSDDSDTVCDALDYAAELGFPGRRFVWSRPGLRPVGGWRDASGLGEVSPRGAAGRWTPLRLRNDSDGDVWMLARRADGVDAPDVLCMRLYDGSWLYVDDDTELDSDASLRRSLSCKPFDLAQCWDRYGY